MVKVGAFGTVAKVITTLVVIGLYRFIEKIFGFFYLRANPWQIY
jgi:hypothetical protein